MPPKVVQKEIVPLFSTKLSWWEYVDYTTEQINQINEFLTTYEQQFQLTDNIYQNFDQLCHNIGTIPHSHFKKQPEYPTYKDPQQKDSQENVREQEINFLLLTNCKLDAVTLSFLSYLFSRSKLSCIKFCNNSFNEKELNLVGKMVQNPKNQITKIFFEWNPLNVESPFYKQISESVNLSQNINDDVLSSFCDNLMENPNSVLKFIDLYDNKLTAQGFSKLGQLISQSKTLEYIGLSKNNISKLSEVEEIYNKFLRSQLTPQQLEEHRALETEKEAIVERNKKAKKPEPVPELNEIVEYPVGSGNFFTVKNECFKTLNLSMNKIENQCLNEIQKILQNTGDSFSLILEQNKIDEKNSEKLKKKFKTKITI